MVSVCPIAGTCSESLFDQQVAPPAIVAPT